MRILPLLLGLASACAASPPAYEPPELPPSGYLSEPARAAIAERMIGHKDEMTSLLWAVTFLDHMGVESITARLLAARARPRSEAMQAVPAEYFAIEREATARLEALSALARAKDPDGVEMARAYGQLAETCVRCHAVYLFGP